MAPPICLSRWLETGLQAWKGSNKVLFSPLYTHGSEGRVRVKGQAAWLGSSGPQA